MLEQWIQNVPISLLRQILTDARMGGTRIWQLARDELPRRAQDALAA